MILVSLSVQMCWLVFILRLHLTTVDSAGSRDVAKAIEVACDERLSADVEVDEVDAAVDDFDIAPKGQTTTTDPRKSHRPAESVRKTTVNREFRILTAKLFCSTHSIQVHLKQSLLNPLKNSDSNQNWFKIYWTGRGPFNLIQFDSTDSSDSMKIKPAQAMFNKHPSTLITGKFFPRHCDS